MEETKISDIPNIKISLPSTKNDIVSAEEIITHFNEILSDIRDDRKEVDSVLQNFIEMVMNSGDCSTSSKEAMTTLFKIKTDLTDKKIRVAETLIKSLRDVNTPKYFAVHQENNINSAPVNPKRQLIKDIQKENENGNK